MAEGHPGDSLCTTPVRLPGESEVLRSSAHPTKIASFPIKNSAYRRGSKTPARASLHRRYHPTSLGDPSAARLGPLRQDEAPAQPSESSLEGELSLEKPAHRIGKPNLIAAATAACDRTVSVGDVIVLDVLVEPLHAALWFAQVDAA